MDEYQLKLHQLIATKVAGNEVVAPEEVKEESSKVIDLMDALKASVKKVKNDKGTA